MSQAPTNNFSSRTAINDSKVELIIKLRLNQIGIRERSLINDSIVRLAQSDLVFSILIFYSNSNYILQFNFKIILTCVMFFKT